MAVIVKICGITNLSDGLAAAEAGADALGFVFWEGSPRWLDFEPASAIIRELPSSIIKVGVFVNAPEEVVRAAIRLCGLDLLQFHGTERPEYCVQFGIKTMKAFGIRDASSLEMLEHYPTDAWLLDSYAADKVGGSGEKFNWDLAAEARKRSQGRPIFLAGGLNSDNVSEAIRRVEPYGVDVSSGVEAAPGKKDHAKVRAFIRAVKEAALS